MLTFCSIAPPSKLAAARVLESGLETLHPGATVLVTECERDTVVGGVANPPRLMHRALTDGAELVAYLDPQVAVYGSLDPALELAREHGIALVRRAAALPDDGNTPSYAELLAAGRISDAFVAVARGEAGERFLEWWAERLEEAASDEDEPWLDLVPDAFPEAVIIDDPGYGVSFWNLHERPLARRGEEALAGGAPLRFIHFAGFRADRPYWLSDDGTRVRVIDDPVLSELCGSYAQQLRASGWIEPKTTIGDVYRLGNGQRVDHLVRDLWQEASDRGLDFGDPRAHKAAEAFVAWVRERADEGGAAGVNRYLLAAYRTRPDLQAAFPDLDGAGGPGLLAWAVGPGRQEVFQELLPRSHDEERARGAAALAVNVIGYLGDTLGLAEAARLYVKGLLAAGVPVSTTAVRPDLPVRGEKARALRAGSHSYEDLEAGVEPAFNLVCLNGDQFQAFLRMGGEEVLGGRPTIGQWGWETDVLPPGWLGAFHRVDEVWVYTSFVAQNLARLSPVPVVVVPMAIEVPDTAGVELELARDDRFTFLFMVDFFSTSRRKNVLGLVEAFTRGFAPGEGPRLLLKTINGHLQVRAADELRHKIGDRPDIELVDRYLDPLQKYALLARADCYVSLHRSEGFGLPLAEAMALGTPVIATGYSGNTDFMTDRNSYLVDWTPTHVGVDCEIYPEHGSWAEPDLDHAAALMRRVWERPEEAASKADRARADIGRLYAPEVAGAIARGRLEQLLDMRLAGAARPQAVPESFQAISRELAFDVRAGAPPVRGGLAGTFRRLVLRLISPFTFHERQLDRALFDGLRELHTELREEREQGKRDRARLGKVEDALAGAGEEE
jgi:hypothetical protein